MQIDSLFWFILIYGFVAQIIVIEIIREECQIIRGERHGSMLELGNGKVATFGVSAGAGVIWWIATLYAMGNTLQSLEESGRIAMLIVLIVGSMMTMLSLSEAIATGRPQTIQGCSVFGFYRGLARLSKPYFGKIRVGY